MAQTVDGDLSSGLRRYQAGLLLATAGAILCLAALAPLLVLVVELTGAGIEGLALWALPRTWHLLASSLAFAGAATLLSLIVGVPLGVAFGRTDVAGRGVAWLLHAFGFFLPPFLIVLGWFHVLGRDGWLGSEASSSALFSAPGLIAVLGFTFAPVVTSLVALGVMNVDPALEEAARVIARPGRVATRILAPAARPAVTLAALVVFALALSELGVPMFLRVDVFAAAVFARLGGVDQAPGEAFALVLPLVPIAIVLLGLERRLAGSRSYAVLGLRGRSRKPLPLRRWRLPVTVLCWSVSLLSVAPVLSLAARALLGGGIELAIEWAGQAPWNGLGTGAIAATVILVLGIVIGHGAARRARSAAWLDALAVLAFITPAPLLGVGLIATWNRPGTQLVYATLAIMVVGFVARYAVVGVRVFASVVTQVPVHLEDAASVAGASYVRRLVRIVLPLGARGAAFAWLLALVFCLRDLETAVLFYPPGLEPLSVRIFTLEANGPEALVAGLGALHAGITAVVLAAGFSLLVARRAL